MNYAIRTKKHRAVCWQGDAERIMEVYEEKCSETDKYEIVNVFGGVVSIQTIIDEFNAGDL